MTWILVLFIYAGPLSSADSVALTSVHGFASEQSCNQAGKQADKLVSGTVKRASFICVRT